MKWIPHDLYIGLTQFAMRSKHLADAELFVVNSARWLFGADSVVLWRLSANQKDASPTAIVPERTSVGEDALASAAARNEAVFTLLGNRGVVQGLGADPDRTRWALQLEYRNGLPDGWVRDNLRRVGPSLYSVLNQARSRERNAKVERERQKVLHETSLLLHPGTALNEVFDLIVKSITRLGFECAQLSLVFPKENQICAIKSSGNFQLIEGISKRDLASNDVKATVVRSRSPQIVYNCEDPDSGCDPTAIALSGLKSEVLLPLIVADRAIGTLQVGNSQRVGAFQSDDVTLLQLFADAAAIAIQMARERETLDLTLRAVGDAMVVTDFSGRITSLNDSYTRLFGVGLGDAAPLTVVSEGDDTPLVQVAFERHRPLQTLRRINGQQYIVTAAGREDAFGRYEGGVEVVDTESPLRGLTEALASVISTEDEADFGRAVVESLRDQFRYSRCRVYQMDPNARFMASRWCSGMSPDVTVRFEGSQFTYTRNESSPTGDGFESFRHGNPVVVVRELYAEKGLPVRQVVADSQHRQVLVLPEEDLHYMKELDKLDVREWMDVPLTAGTRPIGKISIDQKGRDEPFGLEEVELMKIFGHFASHALARIHDLRTARAASLVDTRPLRNTASQEEVVWSFLVHLTMEGGPGLNRVAIFMRQPNAREFRGFLCHGAATHEEFTTACNEVLSEEREAAIARVVADKLRGELTDAERRRIAALQELTVAPSVTNGPMSRAASTHRTEYVSLPKRDLDVFYEKLEWTIPREAIVCPLVFGGQCEGILYADKAFLVEGVSRRGEEKLLEGAAVQIAAALRSARLAEELRHQVLLLSHTSKAPYISIHGLAQALIDRAKDPYDALMLKYIVAEAQRGTDTTRRLLLMAKLSAGEWQVRRESLDICELLEETLAPYRLLLDLEEIRSEITAEPDPLEVKADAVLLGSAISELAANSLTALKVTPLRRADRYLRVVCKLMEDRLTYTILFETPGPPVLENLQEEMFNKFVSGTGGTGLGLPMVRDIVSLHGGEVSYEYDLGGSSTFVLTLPLKGEADDRRGGSHEA